MESDPIISAEGGRRCAIGSATSSAPVGVASETHGPRTPGRGGITPREPSPGRHQPSRHASRSGANTVALERPSPVPTRWGSPGRSTAQPRKLGVQWAGRHRWSCGRWRARRCGSSRPRPITATDVLHPPLVHQDPASCGSRHHVVGHLPHARHAAAASARSTRVRGERIPAEMAAPALEAPQQRNVRAAERRDPARPRRPPPRSSTPPPSTCPKARRPQHLEQLRPSPNRPRRPPRANGAALEAMRDVAASRNSIGSAADNPAAHRDLDAQSGEAFSAPKSWRAAPIRNARCPRPNEAPSARRLSEERKRAHCAIASGARRFKGKPQEKRQNDDTIPRRMAVPRFSRGCASAHAAPPSTRPARPGLVLRFGFLNATGERIGGRAKAAIASTLPPRAPRAFPSSIPPPRGQSSSPRAHVRARCRSRSGQPASNHRDVFGRRQ